MSVGGWKPLCRASIYSVRSDDDGPPVRVFVNSKKEELSRAAAWLPRWRGVDYVVSGYMDKDV